MQDDATEVGAAAEDAPLSEPLAQAIARLWAAPPIRTAYDARARYQLNDSAAFFLDKAAGVIAAPGYLPSLEDVLMSRVRTTGIVDETITIDGVSFSILDVGGQRNQRAKWIHSFEGVTCVIFIASLSEYDQVLAEDATVNRLTEALDLFDEIGNSRWFSHSSLILFLNKRDLFERKITRVGLRHEGGDGVAPRFLDYEGGDSADAALQYITAKFLARLKTRSQPVRA